MRTLLIFALLVILAGCCKQENEEMIPPVVSECSELGTTPFQGWNYIVDSASYLYPCFNPNNPNEIIFTHRAYGNGLTKLYRYDLTTHSKTLLHTGDQIFSPDWGSNDWILMNLSGNSIWKIKPDGTELTQLLNTGNDFYPIWNSDATIFGAFRGSFNDNLQKTILYTDTAVPLDTLESTSVGNSNWSLNNFTCSISGYGPKVSDLISDTILYSQLGEYNHEGGCHWLNIEEFLWSYEEGIFKTNYATGYTELVKESCRTRMYQSPTYHPAINKIIWTRVDMKQLNDFDIEVKSRLFMMNPDGSEETEIIIE
jgi:hypothetical protein